MAESDAAAPPAAPEGVTPAEPPAAEAARAAEESRPEEAPRARSRSYIMRHWRGELSLPLAYWINDFLGAALLVGGALAIGPAIESQHPLAAMEALIGYWIAAPVFMLWQFVGAWRSADEYRARGGARLWSGATRAMVSINLLLILYVFADWSAPQISVAARLAGDEKLARHEIHLLRNDTELEIAGGISAGLADEVRRILDAAPQVRVVHLNSLGGQIAEARSLHDLIRERGLTTYSSAYCLGACTIAFLGGVERYIAPQAKLGFQRDSFPGFSAARLGGEKELGRQALVEDGVDSKFAARAYATPNTRMWYPSSEELLEAHVISGVVDGTRFALSGVGRSRPEVEEEMLRVPVFAALSAADKPGFESIVDEMHERLKSGATGSEFVAIVGARAAALIKKYLSIAPDDAVNEMANVMVQEMNNLYAKDPEACYRWIFPDGGALDPAALVAPELQARDHAALTRLVATGVASPQPVPSRQNAQPLLAKIFATLQRKNPGDFAVVLAMANRDQTLDHAAVCRATIALYQGALGLGRSDGAAAIRYLSAGTKP